MGIRHELGDAANVTEMQVQKQLVENGRLLEISKEPDMPDLEADDLYKLLGDVLKNIEHMKRPDPGHVDWSLADGFVIAGSWNDWQAPFVELKRLAHSSAYQGSVAT